MKIFKVYQTPKPSPTLCTFPSEFLFIGISDYGKVFCFLSAEELKQRKRGEHTGACRVLSSVRGLRLADRRCGAQGTILKSFPKMSPGAREAAADADG